MPHQAEDLWPADFGDIRPTPAGVMRKQANRLAEKTQGRVMGQVATIPAIRGFAHDFRVIAPSLGHYAFSLFTVSHGTEFYPLRIVGSPLSEGEIVANDEAEFKDWLRKIFQHPQSVQVVNALLSQMEPVGAA